MKAVLMSGVVVLTVLCVLSAASFIAFDRWGRHRIDAYRPDEIEVLSVTTAPDGARTIRFRAPLCILYQCRAVVVVEAPGRTEVTFVRTGADASVHDVERRFKPGVTADGYQTYLRPTRWDRTSDRTAVLAVDIEGNGSPRSVPIVAGGLEVRLPGGGAAR